MPTPLRISQHAVDRARERMPWMAQMPHATVCSIVKAMALRGFEWGGQRKGERYLRNTDNNTGQEMIFACAMGRYGEVVVTVLTLDQATANLQVEGMMPMGKTPGRLFMRGMGR